MVTNNIKEELTKITKEDSMEKSLKKIIPDYIQLKIFYLKQEINRYELKWSMNYTEYEQKTANNPDLTKWEAEKEYYDWGEKVALLDYYQKLQKEWS